jgi:hypothetical protein
MPPPTFAQYLAWARYCGQTAKEAAGNIFLCLFIAILCRSRLFLSSGRSNIGLVQKPYKFSHKSQQMLYKMHFAVLMEVVRKLTFPNNSNVVIQRNIRRVHHC